MFKIFIIAIAVVAAAWLTYFGLRASGVLSGW